MNEATNTVYVANSTEPVVTIVEPSQTSSGTTWALAGWINTGTTADATSIAVYPVTDTVYVASEPGNLISVLNGASNTFASTITLSESPTALATNDTANLVYVEVI